MIVVESKLTVESILSIGALRILAKAKLSRFINSLKITK